jgi:hypothetical protein
MNFLGSVAKAAKTVTLATPPSSQPTAEVESDLNMDSSDNESLVAGEGDGDDLLLDLDDTPGPSTSKTTPKPKTRGGGRRTKVTPFSEIDMGVESNEDDELNLEDDEPNIGKTTRSGKGAGGKQ